MFALVHHRVLPLWLETKPTRKIIQDRKDSLEVSVSIETGNDGYNICSFATDSINQHMDLCITIILLCVVKIAVN
jgi:hypothetical protein